MRADPLTNSHRLNMHFVFRVHHRHLVAPLQFRNRFLRHEQRVIRQIEFDPDTVLTPTKVGQFWSGNSAARINFSQISTEPVMRWKRELSDDEIGWIEWHCRDLMPEFGYEPKLTQRELRYFLRPIRGERPREYIKSRAYSLRDDWIHG